MKMKQEVEVHEFNHSRVNKICVRHNRESHTLRGSACSKIEAVQLESCAELNTGDLLPLLVPLSTSCNTGLYLRPSEDAMCQAQTVTKQADKGPVTISIFLFERVC